MISVHLDLDLEHFVRDAVPPAAILPKMPSWRMPSCGSAMR